MIVYKELLLMALKWCGAILALATLFYLTARLGLILAIPPGYATSIWLPSGISLAFVLLFGYRIAPAIWLGSFLVNFQLSGNMLIAGSIGLGSMLQALLGAYLVRRFVGFPNPLNSDKEIIGFLLLGGPVSCLLAATWGSLTIWFAKQLPFNDFLYNWFIWWCGDTIGVLVFTPIILIWTASPKEVWQPRRISVGLPLCVLFSLLTVFIMYTSRWKDEKIIQDFENKAQSVAAFFEVEASLLDEASLTSKLIEATSDKAFSNNLVLKIFDVSRENQKDLVYSSSNFQSFSGLMLQKTIKLKDHKWLLNLTPAQTYVSVNRSWEIWIVPLCGVLLTGLLGALLLGITGKSAMIEGVVNDRTKALKDANITMLNEIKLRQEVEDALEKYTKELSYSNHELAQFANVASHDLKEPLRMIVIYLQRLEVEYGDQLAPQAKEYVVFTILAAKRMQGLINGLLEYSSVGARHMEKTFVDCEEILKQTLENLSVMIYECNADITHDHLPIVYADPTQLLQLFQNVVGNALKYSGKNDVKIHVGVQVYKTSWLFWVKDNGIGISAEYFARIFEIFQRLHTSKEYQGSGIGLALCKKIIEQHGGQIWVESEVGSGSTFYFTLPIKRNESEELT